MDLVQEIVRKAPISEEYTTFAERVLVLFDILEDRGIDTEENESRVFNGKTIHLHKPIKKLQWHYELYESRVNWHKLEYGAFRAIFFCEIDARDNQYIYFTKAVIKKETRSKEFEDAIKISKKIREKYYKKER